MHRAKKRQRRLEEDRLAADQRRARTWKRFLVLVAVVAVLQTLPPFFFGRGGGESLEISPDAIIGTWVTDDPRYVDRALTIGPQEISLGLGDGTEAASQIRSIRRERGAVNWDYTVTYVGSEGDEVIEIFLFDDGTLRLKNPPEVWWSRKRD